MSYVVRSRYGNFRLVLARGGGARPARDDELTHRLWRTFDQRLAWRDGEALAAALELREELHPQSSRFGQYSLETLRQQIESALWFGHIRFREIVPVAAPPEQPSGLAAKAPRTAAPSTSVEPTWFELTLVDEVGQGLDGQEIGFSVSGKQQQLPTNGTGTARLDDVQAASSFASARLPDIAALKEVLKPRWDKIRTERILTEDDATLVFLRGQSLDTVSLESETPKLVSIQPYVEQARLLGMFFDTNKNFLLPGAIPALRNIKRLYDRNPKSTLLVVGHTDTSGEPSYNDPLSLERAESVAQYLTDDVDAWLKRYGQGVAEKKRWGQAEDLLMIEALGLQGPQLETPIDRVGQSPVAWYQKWHNKLQGRQRAANWELLAEDAKIGPKTRAQLIADYMNFDDTTLPEGIKLLTHGCGENFPLERVEALDPEVSDAMDRRVELFFFDADLGIQPPAPGKYSKPGSLEYPEWCRRARRVHDFLSHANGPLCVAVHAPSDQETRLIVASAGQPVRVLSVDEARRDGDTATFAFIPEFLPASVQFKVEREGQVKTASADLSPVALRDALFVGDTGTAANTVGGRAGARGKVTPVSAPGGTGPSKPKRDLPQKLTLAVHWENPGHRFLKDIDVTLTDISVPGSTLALEKVSESAGEVQFAVPPHVTRFELNVVVPSPVVTILTLKQRFLVTRTSGGQVTITRDKSSFRSAPQHPRIQSIDFNAGDPTQAVCWVNLDLLFLDVTKYLRKLDSNPTLGELKQKEKIKSKVVVLEYTDPLGPASWPIIVPPACRKDGVEIGALLFFRHEVIYKVVNGRVVSGIQDGVDDADYENAIGPYFCNPINPGQYRDSENQGEYDNYPYFGWDQQLRESGKKLVVMLPIPRGEGFSGFSSPKAEHEDVLRSAVVALFASRYISKSRGLSPQLSRVAIGAWSSGSTTLLEWAKVLPKRNQAPSRNEAPGEKEPPRENEPTREDEPAEPGKFVDEIYMFDGKDGQKIHVERVLKRWFEVDKDRRRLCLIGTAYFEDAAIALKSALTHSNVFVHPGDPKYFYDSPEYKRGLATGSAPPLQFRAHPKDAPLPNDASTKTNIFIESESLHAGAGGRVVHTMKLFSPLPMPAKRTVGTISKEEAALIAAVELPQLTNKLIPIVAGNQFTPVMDWLDQPGGTEASRARRHRHSWSTFGGTTRNGAFVGFFRMCLERSGF
ncbi:MAG: OmpA family protein [Polyangiaceae bacterium]